MSCDKNRLPQHLWQKFDPTSRQWIWECNADSACIIARQNQASTGAASNADTTHGTNPRVTRATHWSQQDTVSAETISGAHHQTPLLDTSTSYQIGSRVYARFLEDNKEYAATILGSYRGGHVVTYDIEPQASYRVSNANVRPLPPAPTTMHPLPPDKIICGLHKKPRGISNLKWQPHPITKIHQMICKPGFECALRSTRLEDAEQYGPHAGLDTTTAHDNPEAGTDDTSSTSSWDEATKQRLAVSAKMTINGNKKQRSIASLEAKASAVVRTTTQNFERAAPTSTPPSTSRARVRQGAPLSNDDSSAETGDTRRARPHRETFSYRDLSKGQHAGNAPKSATFNPTMAAGAQQPPPSHNTPTSLPELGDMLSAFEHLVLLNSTAEQNAGLQPTAPQATAPAGPLQPTKARHVEFYVHGGQHSLKFQRSPNTTIDRLKLEIQHRIKILDRAQTLSYKSTVMEDSATLRDYALQQDAVNIIDLTVDMSPAATPSNAPHTPRPPETPSPADITASLQPELTEVLTALSQPSPTQIEMNEVPVEEMT